jgi:manganese/zinc/iron transport system ATP- binding protein
MSIAVNNPIIELHNLTVTYQNRPVLWNVDYTLPQASMTGILGPNGSGKTTMIKTIMGLIKPAGGYVKLYGKDLEDVREKVAYVPQRNAVDWDFPATVFDTVLMGRYNKGNLFGRVSRRDKELAMEAIAQVQLDPFANRQIAQLSGGQQQRVFIARALAQQADLYFFDEPFAGVDMATEQAIIELFRHMQQQGKTIVVVHHDLQTAPAYFDWLVMINTRLVAAGPTEEVFGTELLNQTFGGKLNILSKVGDLIRKEKLPIREG